MFAYEIILLLLCHNFSLDKLDVTLHMLLSLTLEKCISQTKRAGKQEVNTN